MSRIWGMTVLLSFLFSFMKEKAGEGEDSHPMLDSLTSPFSCNLYMEQGVLYSAVGLLSLPYLSFFPLSNIKSPCLLTCSSRASFITHSSFSLSSPFSFPYTLFQLPKSSFFFFFLSIGVLFILSRHIAAFANGCGSKEWSQTRRWGLVCMGIPLVLDQPKNDWRKGREQHGSRCHDLLIRSGSRKNFFNSLNSNFSKNLR